MTGYISEFKLTIFVDQVKCVEFEGKSGSVGMMDLWLTDMRKALQSKNRLKVTVMLSLGCLLDIQKELASRWLWIEAARSE